MCRVVLIVVAVLSLRAVAVPAAVEGPRADFYVAPNGDDSRPGTEVEPFATLAKARDAVRRLKARGPQRDILVCIRGGVYRLQETVVFSVKDSAAQGHTITYAAAPGERPVISTGVEITGWKKADGPLPGLPSSARGKVWVADVPKGLGRFNTLHDAGKMLPRARSKGVTPTKLYKRGQPADRVTLDCPPGLIRPWSNVKDVEVVVVPTYPWVVNILPLAGADPKTGIVKTAVPATYPLGKPNFGHFPEGSLWVENALEFLDEPGEWVLNTTTRKLYLWPRSDHPGESIVAPTLTELIRVEGEIDYDGPRDTPVNNLVFRGLTFTGGDRFSWEPTKTGWGLQHDWEMFDRPTAMVRFRGAEGCAVEHCRFAHSGGSGVRLDLHCQKNRITGNVIEHVGGVGVLLAGYGPGTTNVNKHNTVSNNHVHRVGELLWHSPGIFAWQSGENEIANNLVHHTPYTAIVVSGRISYDRQGRGECSRTVRWDEIDRVLPDKPKPMDWYVREPFMHGRKNRVVRNEIHHTMEVLGDGNCIYISGTGGGNLVKQNYLHDVTSPRINANIRCDDDQHKTIMEDNVILRCCGEGFIIKGDNTIVNNIVADLRPAGADRTPCLHQRGYIVLPYGQVKGATIQRNIFCSLVKDQRVLTESRSRTRGPSLLRDCNADYNLYFNRADPDWGGRHLREQQAFGVETHSLSADPLFEDLDGGDLRLKPGSPALKLGFKPIELDNVGIDADSGKRR